MTRYTDILKAIVILCYILFSGCSSSLRSGKSYVVENILGSGYVVKFKGLDELFTVPDKLKIGDTITVYRTFKENKVTIY